MNVPNAALQLIREQVTPPVVQAVSLCDNRHNGKGPGPFTFVANGGSETAPPSHPQRSSTKLFGRELSFFASGTTDLDKVVPLADRRRLVALQERLRCC